MSIKRNWAYLKYLIRHKYFVFKACGWCGIFPWQAIVHDASKLYPDEWKAYSKTFYDEKGQKQFKGSEEFNIAWLKHCHRNKHHWQYWIQISDNGLLEPRRMPQRYVKEMVADWMGAGRAITGKWEVAEWYEKNRDKIVVHPKTQDDIDLMISVVGSYGQ